MSTNFIGRVFSKKMAKTAMVLVNRYTVHPLYKKRVRKTKKFMTHDPEESCNVGDLVLIKSSRPHSKRKCFELKEILKRAPTFLYEQEQQAALVAAAALPADGGNVQEGGSG